MSFPGVEFGARMITIDGKQIKLQIWDTVRYLPCCTLNRYDSLPEHATQSTPDKCSSVGQFSSVKLSSTACSSIIMNVVNVLLK